MTYYDTYLRNPLVDENVFRGMPAEDAPLPTFEQARALLPEPVWDGHPAAIDCYWKTWEIGFRNLCRPAPGSGFVSNFWDTAFNGCLFMWDSVFITLFARYGRRAFDAQRTLDNLYAKQHPDGFICREIREADGEDQFHRFDAAGTGPNVMAWSEWEYYLTFGDRARLTRVFPVLAAYHQWWQRYRSWPDGTYWSSGWGCGMDNQPRVPEKYLRWEADRDRAAWLNHGHMSWIDACLQHVLSARLLAAMAEALGRPDGAADLRREADWLTESVNARMWDERAAFYVDRRRDGTLSDVKTIGAYWALLAGVVPAARLERFLAHLDDPREFNRPHRAPSLSADHPAYRADGGYWLGGVWAPTNYMLLRGLTNVGRDELAHAIGINHLDHVTRVFERTGTVWENYAPEEPAPGNPAKPDFVGWTGLPPIAVLLEYAFGLRADVPRAALTWDVRLTDAHGVRHYPFSAAGQIDLACARRASPGEKPRIEAKSNMPLTLTLKWAGGEETLSL
jgi:hypothetical protein